MKKVKKEDKSYCSEIRSPFVKRCRYIPALPSGRQNCSWRRLGSVEKRVWASDLTVVTCGIFLCVTVRESARDNCKDILGFRGFVWNDPEASMFKVFHTRLQVICVR